MEVGKILPKEESNCAYKHFCYCAMTAGLKWVQMCLKSLHLIVVDHQKVPWWWSEDQLERRCFCTFDSRNEAGCILLESPPMRSAA